MNGREEGAKAEARLQGIKAQKREVDRLAPVSDVEQTLLSAKGGDNADRSVCSTSSSALYALAFTPWP